MEHLTLRLLSSLWNICHSTTTYFFDPPCSENEYGDNDGDEIDAKISFVGIRGPIYKISYDLSYDYRKFIVRSTYDSDLKRAEIFLRNIVS